MRRAEFRPTEKRGVHRADCIFRIVWGTAFLVIGLLYIPWLALLGALVCLSLIFSCTRLAVRFGWAAPRNKPDENA